MAETSAISWTRSTFNPWIGCTKVGPGCDHCYAEALDHRHRWQGATHWGPGVARMRTGIHNWNEPLRWDRKAAEERRTGVLAPKSTWSGRVGFWPVFCASLADVFDNEVPDQWREDLFSVIERTPHLSWLLVTKRIGNVRKMVPAWSAPGRRFPANVRLLITVVNQEEADRDVPKLLELPCRNGISYEPALGPVDWRRWVEDPCTCCVPALEGAGQHHIKCPSVTQLWGVDWIIVGGESSQGSGAARMFDLDWASRTVAQCASASVPVFVKQLGSYCGRGYLPSDSAEREFARTVLKDRAGADPLEWPEGLRVQQFPV